MVIQGGKNTRTAVFGCSGLPVRAGRFILVQAFIVLGLFYFHPFSVRAANGLNINEIAWMGGLASSNDEWIELYNASGDDVDITGWRLEAADGTPSIVLQGSIRAGDYFLLERTDDDSAPGVVANQVYTGALANNGEELGLFDSTGKLVDEVQSDGFWPAGNNASKQTMVRDESGGWSDSLTAGGTPGRENDQALTPETEAETQEEDEDEKADAEENQPVYDDVQEDNEAGAKEEVEKADTGDVLINEIVADPVDEEDEWIELFNRSKSAINLVGWYIREGSGAKTQLDGQLGVSGLNRFYLIMKPKGNLNNSGDIIELRDADDKLIDRLVYGDWESSYVVERAPAAPDPYSLIRKWDGNNSYNNKEDFALTLTKTPGHSNILNSGEEEPDNENEYSRNVRITEIFPNPVGSDNESEFIELYNEGFSTVKLKGWRISDASRNHYEFGQGAEIAPRRYLLVLRAESGLALNNDKDEVALFWPDQDEPVAKVAYTEVYEGYSLCFDKATEKFVWSEAITPGKANTIKTRNNPPEADFSFPETVWVGESVYFDSSDSLDQDRDELQYAWDFGDGNQNELACPEHTFLSPGEYMVSLTLDDGRDITRLEKVIRVLADEAGNDGSAEVSSAVTECLRLNEVLPDPSGSDLEGEFLELFNCGEVPVDLWTWSVDDKEGGSAPYHFASGIVVEAGDFFVVKRSISGIAFNNDGDELRLIKDNEIMDSARYGKVIENCSFAYGDGSWNWSLVQSPGSRNVIKIPSEGVLETTDEDETESGSEDDELVEMPILGIQEIKDLAIGASARARGTVILLPGDFASQYFYIFDGSGIQVYSYYKEFPDLSLGDVVEVKGSVSESRGEKRIKTSDIDDIVISATGAKVNAIAGEYSEFGQENIGDLVIIEGEVIETKSNGFYVGDLDGEVDVQFKSNANIEMNINEGAKVRVTGILGMGSSGFKLFPRSGKDVIVNSDNQSQPRVLGAYTSSGAWELESRDKRLEIFKYLLVTVTAIVLLISARLIKLVHF